jgi:hypothetical protein
MRLVPLLKAEAHVKAHVRMTEHGPVIVHDHERKYEPGQVEAPPGKPGHHWGAATPTNPMARVLCAERGYLRDPKQGMAEVPLKPTPQELADGQAYRAYAQHKLAQTPHEAMPAFFRGVLLSPRVQQGIVSGEIRRIPLTGATTWTPDEETANDYAESDTVARHYPGDDPAKGPKGGFNPRLVVFHVERDAHFDTSATMWHDHAQQPGKPFEIATDADALEILEVSVDPSGGFVGGRTIVKCRIIPWSR